MSKLQKLFLSIFLLLFCAFLVLLFCIVYYGSPEKLYKELEFNQVLWLKGNNEMGMGEVEGEV